MGAGLSGGDPIYLYEDQEVEEERMLTVQELAYRCDMERC